MTDRFHTLTVVLEKDIREDDAVFLMNAIRAMRGVVSVGGVISDFDSHMAYTRARAELGNQLWEILYPKDKK
jgi:hypothetical protein